MHTILNGIDTELKLVISSRRVTEQQHHEVTRMFLSKEKDQRPNKNTPQNRVVEQAHVADTTVSLHCSRPDPVITGWPGTWAQIKANGPNQPINMQLYLSECMVATSSWIHCDWPWVSLDYWWLRNQRECYSNDEYTMRGIDIEDTKTSL